MPLVSADPPGTVAPDLHPPGSLWPAESLAEGWRVLRPVGDLKRSCEAWGPLRGITECNEGISLPRMLVARRSFAVRCRCDHGRRHLARDARSTLPRPARWASAGNSKRPPHDCSVRCDRHVAYHVIAPDTMSGTLPTNARQRSGLGPRTGFVAARQQIAGRAGRAQGRSCGRERGSSQRPLEPLWRPL